MYTIRRTRESKLMRRKRYAPIITVFLALLLSTSPAFAAVPVTQDGSPIINSITPNEGGNGTIITIIGKNFGENLKAVAAGTSYIKVGGFINTDVVSWTNLKIQISAPSLQEAVSDASKLGLFWLMADVVTLGTLTVATKLFDAAVTQKSTELDNTVSIKAVVFPFRESNEKPFTYLAQPPLAGVVGIAQHLAKIVYDVYGKNVIGLITDPQKLAKEKGQEIMRSVVELPLFVNDLFRGRGTIQVVSTPPKVGVADNTETPKDESENKKPLPPPPTEKKKASASILVVDQFSEPVEEARVWMEDERGKTYPSENWVDYWNTDRVGRLHFSYDDKGQIPNGKFNIHIEKENYSQIKESIDISSSPVAVIIFPDKFILYKLPIVTGILLDTLGQPAGNQTYMSSVDSTGGYYPIITITDSYGKVVYERGGGYGCCDSKTGRFESKPLPPGHYILKVSIPGGYLKPEVVMATKEFDISYNQKEVWLDRITVVGIKTNF